MKQIINCVDGTVEIVELTDADIKQQSIDSAKIAAEEKKIEEAAKEAQEAKAAVEAKLTALGLTAEDLKALGL